MPEFREWPKIARWSKQTWVITEKIDGTNACVIVPEDKLQPLAAQSRNRIITPGDDNFGFAKWVEENSETLRWLGPGYHYGEWWGAGVGRRYNMTEKRFSLFETWRKPDDVPPCCSIVPILEIITGDVANSISYCMALLKKEGSQAAKGFMQPEGIVIYNVQTKTHFKKLLEGDELHKSEANGISGRTG